MIKKGLLLLLLFSSVAASSFADGLLTLDLGNENYIDLSGSDEKNGNKGNRMVQNIFAGFSASYIWRNFLGGLYVNGVFAVTEPNFILCEPGVELGFMVWYPELFYTLMAHGAPVFHNENYIENSPDIVAGGKVRVYSKIFDKNLFFVFGFGADYYIKAGNMAYTITVGLSREAYFERSSSAPPAASAPNSGTQGTRTAPAVSTETPADSTASIDIALPE
jgi:hypothetical protein